MGSKIKEQSQLKPVRILVVSQTYRNFKGFENIDLNVGELDDLYSRKRERLGKEFEDNFKVEKFFSVRNRDFEDLRDSIASGNFTIIHFSMHSFNGEVYFSESARISYADFILAFADIHGTEAVLLNICNSREIAEKIAKKVPWVLGWDEEVTVRETAKASNLFYSSLFNENSLSVCFRRLLDKPGLKIFKDSALFNHSEEAEELPYDDNTKNKRETDKKVEPEQKKSERRIRPALIISLALILLVLAAIFFMKYGKVSSASKEIDSLQIISPVSGTIVRRETDIVLSAKLRPGGVPWLFVRPPAGKAWWPQYEGQKTRNGNWEVPVLLGNLVDSGQFTIKAIVIKDHIADEMKAWLASQGTKDQSDPLINEVLQSLFWYASDSVTVNRIVE